MDPKDEINPIELLHTSTIDLTDIELNQRKLLIELEMKRDQVKQLRDHDDAQNLRNHRLKRDLETASARVTELEMELEAARATCASFTSQFHANGAAHQLRSHNERLQAECASLRELLRDAETESRGLRRELDDLGAARKLEAASIADSIRRESASRDAFLRLTATFEVIKKEYGKVNEISEALKKIKGDEDGRLREVAKSLMGRNVEMEKELIYVKAKLDALEDLMRNYSFAVPQNVDDNVCNELKKEVEGLKKELNAERELTFLQNKRLRAEIAQNVTSCLHIDKLEDEIRQLKASSANTKEVGIQTDC